MMVTAALATGLASGAAAGGTLATIGTVLSVAGTVFGALQSFQTAKANEAIQKQNAEINRRNAELASARAKQAAEEERREGRIRLGRMRAQIGGSGGGFDATNVSILASQAEQTELEAQKILFEGTVDSQGFLQEASINELKAKQKSNEATGALVGGVISAGTDVLQGKKSFL